MGEKLCQRRDSNPRPSDAVHPALAGYPSLRLSWPLSDVLSWPLTSSQFPGKPLPGAVAGKLL